LKIRLFQTKSPATPDNDNDCVSIAPQSEAGWSSSSSSSSKRKWENGTVIWDWSFQLMVKADFCHDTTAVEKEKLLRENLGARTGDNRPLSVIGVVVLCDRLLFSQPPDSDGLALIEVHGYVQASHAKPQSTMKKWIDSATWTPVPDGLTSDNEYMYNMRRFKDLKDSDAWTRLLVFGSFGANNVGRSERVGGEGRKAARDGRYYKSAPICSLASSFRRIIEQGLGFHRSIITGTRLLLAHPPRAAPAPGTPGAQTAPNIIDERWIISPCDVSWRTADVYIQLVRGTILPGAMIRVSRVRRMPRLPRPSTWSIQKA
jgi:hypothetical protein